MPSLDIKTLNKYIPKDRERYGFFRLRICDKKFRVGKSILSKSQLGPTRNTNFLEFFASSLSTHTDKLNYCDGYIDETDEYVFQKSPRVFESLLDFLEAQNLPKEDKLNSPDDANQQYPVRAAIANEYQISGIHLPVGVCPSIFVRELSFWGFDAEFVAECCRPNYFTGLIIPSPRSSILSLKFIEDECDSTARSHSIFETINHKEPPTSPQLNALSETSRGQDGDDISETDQFTNVKLGAFRCVLWDFFEDPTSSKGAKIFSLMSVGVVLLSVLDMVLASMPELQVEDPRPSYLNKVPHPILVYIEVGCIIWFTAEFFIRLAIAGDKIAFLKVPFNIVDILSVCPFYLELILAISGINTDNLQNVKGALMMLRILRVLRVARIFKVAKYSSSLQNLGGTFTSSIGEFAMILMFIGVVIILFSTTIYFMEKDHPNTQFTSIPASFWWCIITMTTVGYGDMTPATFAGQLVASITSVSGVICLAFPITLIIDNFGKSREAKAEAQELEDARLASEAEMLQESQIHELDSVV